MTDSPPDRPPGAPRAVVLLPIALLLHQAEEWFGGFPAWSAAILGSEISSERFLLVNAFGLVLFVVGTTAARLSPHLAWLGVSLATLIGVNGVLHVVLSLVAVSYSPGTLTGLLVYIPLSAFLLRSSAPRLSRAVFAGSILFGVLVHAFATLAALS